MQTNQLNQCDPETKEKEEPQSLKSIWGTLQRTRLMLNSLNVSLDYVRHGPQDEAKTEDLPEPTPNMEYIQQLADIIEKQTTQAQRTFESIRFGS